MNSNHNEPDRYYCILNKKYYSILTGENPSVMHGDVNLAHFEVLSEPEYLYEPSVQEALNRVANYEPRY